MQSKMVSIAAVVLLVGLGCADAANTGRALLGKCTWTSAGPCMPAGMCSSCTHGSQMQTGSKACSPSTQYVDCQYNSGGSGSSGGGSSGSSQSGSTSGSTSSTTTVSGSGSSSSSSSASGSATFAITASDTAAFDAATSLCFQQICGGADIGTAVTGWLEAFVSACTHSAASCSTTGVSTGGGSSTSTCNVNIQIAQSAFSSFYTSAWASIQNPCSATYITQNPVNVDASICATVTNDVATQVQTWGWGAGHAAVSTDVQTYLQASIKAWEEIFTNICGCSPNCAYCTANPTTSCPPSGCASGSTNGVSLNNNQLVVNSGYYKNLETQLYANAWTSIYDTPCGETASLSLMVGAISQIIDTISGDINALVITVGGASASASWDVSSVGSAIATLCADFFAYAGQVSTTACPGTCQSCASTSITTDLSSTDVANWFYSNWNSIWASGGTFGHPGSDSYSSQIVGSYTSSSLGSATQKLMGDIANCVCPASG